MFLRCSNNCNVVSFILFFLYRIDKPSLWHNPVENDMSFHSRALRSLRTVACVNNHSLNETCPSTILRSRLYITNSTMNYYPYFFSYRGCNSFDLLFLLRATNGAVHLITHGDAVLHGTMIAYSFVLLYGISCSVLVNRARCSISHKNSHSR